MRVLLALLLVSLAPGLQAQDATVFRGQVVDAQAAPVVGAEVKVAGWLRGSQRPTQTEGVTDADGRFSLRFQAPADARVSLTVRAPGLTPHDQRWAELEPGQPVDLGVISLQVAGVVVGRIVNGEGERIGGNWTIRGVSGGSSSAAQLDPETGEFRLEGLPTGKVELSGHLQQAETEPMSVTVQAGSEQFVELRYHGPDPARQIMVDLLRGRARVLPDTKHVFLLDAAGTRHDPVPTDTFDFRPVFEDLEPGTYQVVVEDPRFVRWTEEGVEPGATVAPTLEGASALAIEVVDAETGAALSGFGIEVEYTSEYSFGGRITLHKAGDTPPADGVYTGVITGDCELSVDTPGRPAVALEVHQLKPGETRSLRIEIPRSSRFVGRVVDAEGRPDPLAKVEWTLGGMHGHTGTGTMSTNGVRIPNVHAVLDVGEQGQFELEQAGPGEHALRIRWSDWLVEDLVIELPAEPGEPLVIERPEHGWLEGALDVPSGINPQDVTLTLQSHGRVDRTMAMMRHNQTTPQGLEIKGYAYRLGPLAPGRYGVQASPKSSSRRVQFSSRDEALAEARIRPGETTQVDLDVRSIFPGEVSVSVFASEQPVPGAEVRLVSGGRGGSNGTSLDSNGRARLPSIASGRYTVMLETDAWSYDDPTGLSVRPGKTTDHEVQVPLTERRVSFVDTEGAPLEQVEVTWACGRVQATRSTDRAGALTLELVTGKVFFGLDGDVSVAVDWSAGEDALEVVLPAN